MKTAIIFTGTGPILILTSYDSLDDRNFTAKLKVKGIDKFIAHEIPFDRVKAAYGNHLNVIMGDLKQTDDLRVLDYNGYNILHNFSFSELGEPIYHETA